MLTRQGKRIHDYILQKTKVFIYYLIDSFYSLFEQQFNLMNIIHKNLANQNLEPQAKRPKKTPKILDGTFFSIRKRDGDSIEATCCECSEMKKGTVSSTGNFLSHYKSKHGSRHNELKEYLRKSNADKPKIDRQPTISESIQNTSGDTVSFVFNELL